MIPNIQTSRFETNVSNIQHAFTIEMTPTLAKLLSSQTYSDKLMAAIREPLSNAYDSHVRAGTIATHAADLHLPTQLEPHFSIRDYGTGLSHDNVIRLFFSYGVSDKRGTNDEIGGLGIGAKAFFAYTDQAIITSWHNGMKRTYSANKGADGLPQGMLISVEETTELNGIELSYPVNNEDCSSFRTKVASVLTYLELKVNCNTELQIQKPKIIHSMDIDGYRMEIPAEAHVHRVVMGGIAYAVPNDIYITKCRELHGFACYESFLLYLPIGSVEISASRESLSPTEQDKVFIANLLGKMRSTLQSTDWGTTIEAASSWLDAVKLRSDLGGFMKFDEYLIDGKKVPAHEAMQWRGFRTIGQFVLDGTQPVWTVTRKGRRGNAYQSTPFHTHHTDKPVRAAYWMPSNKRVGWKDWYRENVSLNYHPEDIHLHFFTETMEEAEALAKVFGYDGMIQDGTQCRVPRANRKPASPRPKGIVLSVGRWEIDKIELKDVADPNKELIYIEGSKEGHPDALKVREFLNAGIITASRLSVIDRFNMTKDKAEREFSGMARSLKEWMEKHPELVNKQKLRACAVGAELKAQWKNEWCKFHTMYREGSRFKFKMPEAEFRFTVSELEKYVSAPKITKELAYIQKWHDTQLPKLPSVIQRSLKSDGYINQDTLFQLYEEMK